MTTPSTPEAKKSNCCGVDVEHHKHGWVGYYTCPKCQSICQAIKAPVPAGVSRDTPQGEVLPIDKADAPADSEASQIAEKQWEYLSRWIGSDEDGEWGIDYECFMKNIAPLITAHKELYPST